MEYDYLIEYIIRQIEYYKELKDITNDMIADNLGFVSGKVVSQKHKRKSIDLQYLFNISNYFEISINDLLPPYLSVTDENILKLFLDIESLDEKTKKVIIDSFQNIIRAFNDNTVHNSKK